MASLSPLYSNPKPKQLGLFLLLSLSSFHSLLTLSSSHPSRRCAILSIVFIKPPKPSTLHRHHQITGAVVGDLETHHQPEKHLPLSLSLYKFFVDGEWQHDEHQPFVS
ncbi:Sucrose nonfermenting 4-like protein [Camellia lanceoleosa]|nr:Sucrose nonfermenting 4-like protein [Camellia lanceoleosa]